MAAARNATTELIPRPRVPRNDDCELSSSSVKAATPCNVGSASLFAATANLCLAVLGAGQLTLPYALSLLGLGGGLCGLLLFALLTLHSCHTLSVHAVHWTPSPTDSIDSYAEMVVRVLGPLGDKACTVLIAIYAWGGALSFMVILKSELKYVIVQRSGFTALNESELLVALALIFIFPMGSLQDVSVLKWFSPMGCIAALFITFVVLLCAPWDGTAQMGLHSCSGPAGANLGNLHSDELQWWPESLVGIAAALPLLSFALNMSWAYVPILCTLRDRTTTPRVPCLVGCATTLVSINYFLLAVVGYSMFCGRVQPNILESLGNSVQDSTLQGLMVLLAKEALLVQLTLALPMRFFVARKSILGDKASFVARVSLSAVLVGAAAGLAVLPLNLATVMGVTSSICASMIIYILPAIIDLRTQLPGRFRKVASMLSLLVGVIVMVAGLLANALGVAAGS